MTTKENGAESDDERFGREMMRLQTMIAAANRPDPDLEVLAELRSLLDEHPLAVDIMGDVARWARDEVIRPIAGHQQGIRLGVEQKMRNLAIELGHDESPALERLLIENVALCWTHYHDVLRRYMIVTQESIPIEQADFWERKLERAHRRYLRACDELARVRKMLRPMQVNIGMNQINVAK